MYVCVSVWCLCFSSSEEACRCSGGILLNVLKENLLGSVSDQRARDNAGTALFKTYNSS